MMSFVNTIIDAINQCPEYIGKGIMQLLILTLGGVIVAWITTLVFGRKSEINAVEGTLLKRKMDIYEELCGKLESLKAAVAIPEKNSAAAIKLLQEEGLEFNPINSNQVLSIFDSPKQLTDAFLEIDKYIASKKLYYDNEVMIQTIQFQNYFAVFRRLLVMFEQTIINEGLSLDEKEVVAVERILTLAIGIALQDELIDQMDKVQETMKKSFMNLNFNHREQIKYSYDFFNNPEDPIMGELKDTKILLQREKIRGVVLKSIAIAIAAKMKTNKKN